MTAGWKRSPVAWRLSVGCTAGIDPAVGGALDGHDRRRRPATICSLPWSTWGSRPVCFGLTDRLRRARGLATRVNPLRWRAVRLLLQALADRYRLAVVTTRARPEAVAFLDHSGLSQLLSAVVTRQDVLRMKPHPEPVRTAARLLGVPRRGLPDDRGHHQRHPRCAACGRVRSSAYSRGSASAANWSERGPT